MKKFKFNITYLSSHYYLYIKDKNHVNPNYIIIEKYNY